MATLCTRLTHALNLRHPVVSAPMAFAGGGALAAAVSRAGGLGLIGGGYGDPSWLEEQFGAAAGERVGVGFELACHTADEWVRHVPPLRGVQWPRASSGCCGED
jgi:hypothetical protein